MNATVQLKNQNNVYVNPYTPIPTEFLEELRQKTEEKLASQFKYQIGQKLILVKGFMLETPNREVEILGYKDAGGFGLQYKVKFLDCKNQIQNKTKNYIDGATVIKQN